MRVSDEMGKVLSDKIESDAMKLAEVKDNLENLSQDSICLDLVNVANDLIRLANGINKL